MKNKMTLIPNTSTGKMRINESLISFLNESVNEDIDALTDTDKAIKPSDKKSYAEIYNYYDGLSFGMHLCGALNEELWKEFKDNLFNRCTVTDTFLKEEHLFSPNVYKKGRRFKYWRGN